MASLTEVVRSPHLSPSQRMPRQFWTLAGLGLGVGVGVGALASYYYKTILRKLPQAAVRFGATVDSIQQSGGGWNLQVSNRDTISCDKLVIAAPAAAPATGGGGAWRGAPQRKHWWREAKTCHPREVLALGRGARVRKGRRSGSAGGEDHGSARAAVPVARAARRACNRQTSHGDAYVNT